LVDAIVVVVVVDVVVGEESSRGLVRGFVLGRELSVYTFTLT
jgi:hypothetical protein